MTEPTTPTTPTTLDERAVRAADAVHRATERVPVDLEAVSGRRASPARRWVPVAALAAGSVAAVGAFVVWRAAEDDDVVSVGAEVTEPDLATSAPAGGSKGSVAPLPPEDLIEVARGATPDGRGWVVRVGYDEAARQVTTCTAVGGLDSCASTILPAGGSLSPVLGRSIDDVVAVVQVADPVATVRVIETGLPDQTATPTVVDPAWPFRVVVVPRQDPEAGLTLVYLGANGQPIVTEAMAPQG